MEVRNTSDFLKIVDQLHREGDYKNLLKALNKYIQVRPNSPCCYSLRGQAKHDLKDYLGAITDYSKAIEIDPKEASYYLSRSESKAEVKDYVGALEDIDKAIEINKLSETDYLTLTVIPGFTTKEELEEKLKDSKEEIAFAYLLRGEIQMLISETKSPEIKDELAKNALIDFWTSSAYGNSEAKIYLEILEKK